MTKFDVLNGDEHQKSGGAVGGGNIFEF